MRASDFTRRGLILGSAATTIGAVDTPSQDPARDACCEWLARDAEFDALQKHWQDLEVYLFRERNWHQLSRRQRAALPEVIELDEIDDRLDMMSTANEQLLTALSTICANTAEGLASKLKVAATIVRADENKQAHELIKSALRDLQLITGVDAA